MDLAEQKRYLIIGMILMGVLILGIYVYFFTSEVLLQPVPSQISFSNYVGGGGDDLIGATAVDSSGNVYVAGSTTSPNFVTTDGSSFQGNRDAFIRKYSSTGNLLWSILLGGVNYDLVNSLKVDSSGNVYIGGRAGQGFPTTAGVLQPAFAGDNNPDLSFGQQDGFVAKLDTNGNKVWSSYFGDLGPAFVNDIDIDSAGNIYLGVYNADKDSAPVTPGVIGGVHAGGIDSMAAKISSDGSTLLYGTFIGGVLDDGYPYVEVDSQGRVIVSMSTMSSELPTSLYAYSGGNEIYLMKISADASSIVYSTYLGGSGNEVMGIDSLEIDTQGNIYLAGKTNSNDIQIVSPGANPILQNNNAGGADGYIFKLSDTGGVLAVVSSTYIGGSSDDEINGINVDSSGNVYFTGSTSSNNFPTTANALQSSNAGLGDAFAAVLSSNFQILPYSSYLGGSSVDYGVTLVYIVGQLYASGLTLSADFPFASGYNGNIDGYLTGFILGECSGVQTQSCNTGMAGTCGAGTQTCNGGLWGQCVPNNVQVETGFLCLNGINDDCDLLEENDYDNQDWRVLPPVSCPTCTHGAVGCPVGIEATIVQPNACSNDDILVICDTTAPGFFNSIVADFDGAPCSFVSWGAYLGSEATWAFFNCPVTGASGTIHTVTCDVATSSSYQLGTAQTGTVTIGDTASCGFCDSSDPNNPETRICSSGQQGVCAVGRQTCSNLQWGACMPGTSSAEVCGDSLDNNCDGSVDEGCSTGPTSSSGSGSGGGGGGGGGAPTITTLTAAGSTASLASGQVYRLKIPGDTNIYVLKLGSLKDIAGVKTADITISVGTFVKATASLKVGESYKSNLDGDNDYEAMIGFVSASGTRASFRLSLLNELVGGASATQCSDGSDNDGDGNKDYPGDSDCESILDNDEFSSEQSSSGEGLPEISDGRKIFGINAPRFVQIIIFAALLSAIAVVFILIWRNMKRKRDAGDTLSEMVNKGKSDNKISDNSKRWTNLWGLGNLFKRGDKAETLSFDGAGKFPLKAGLK